MNPINKVLASCLIVILSWAQISPALAQTQNLTGLSGSQTFVPSLSTDTGCSFGQDDRSWDGRGKEGLKSNPLGGPMSRSMDGSMGLLYQIHVLGEVKQPGTYRLPASARLSEALDLAQGIVERGSERHIQLRRKDQGSRNIDFLSFKLLANLDANPYLLDNDVIFVPLKQKTIQVVGTVKRPGLYEMNGENTLEKVLTLVGGFTAGVDTHIPIKVIRYENGEKKLIEVEKEPTALRAFRVEAADVIYVPHLITENKKFDYNVPKLPGDNELFYPSFEDRVFVLGAVETPGLYAFNPYYDVRQYLTLAGGTTKLAKSKKIRIVDSEGKPVKVAAKTEINPGDTIIVPEKYMAPESAVQLVLAISGSILSLTTIVLSLTR